MAAAAAGTALVVSLAVLLFSSLAPRCLGEYPIKVAVEGTVVCQDCSKRGTWNLEGSRPLSGVQVLAQCKIKQTQEVLHSENYFTDDNGYFYAAMNMKVDSRELNSTVMGVSPNVSCLVRLVSSSDQVCDQLTNIGAGFNGASFRFLKHLSDVDLYTVGPMAFLPNNCAGGNPNRPSGDNAGDDRNPFYFPYFDDNVDFPGKHFIPKFGGEH